MKIINLTPHAVNIIQHGEVVREYAPSGQVARLEEWDATVTLPTIGNFLLDGVPVVYKMYGQVQVISRGDFLAKVEKPEILPFPDEEEGVAYIVPMLVGRALAGKRNDIYGPDAGIGGVRDKTGAISGAIGFIKY